MDQTAPLGGSEVICCCLLTGPTVLGSAEATKITPNGPGRSFISSNLGNGTHHDRSLIGDEEAAALTTDDHRPGFAASMAALLAQFNRYLDREDADPVADDVDYRQGVFWMTKKERRELLTEISELVIAKTEATQRTPRAQRGPYLFNLITFPAGHDHSPRPSERKQED